MNMHPRERTLMLRRTFIPLGILILALAAAAVGNARTTAAHKLVGTTGPGFTITVKKAGATVKTLRAGTYTIAVHDLSPEHNFRLRGPGVNKATSVEGTGNKTWTVTLKKGTYTYQCDIHADSGMKGTFKVTS
jgi:plastocyanin